MTMLFSENSNPRKGYTPGTYLLAHRHPLIFTRGRDPEGLCGNFIRFKYRNIHVAGRRENYLCRVQVRPYTIQPRLYRRMIIRTATKQGTAFKVDYLGKVYLVTARHMVTELPTDLTLASKQYLGIGRYVRLMDSSSCFCQY